MKENRIRRFNENSELNISDVSDSYFFVIQHKSGLFLKHQYVTKYNKRSSIALVESEFPCFKSEKDATDYVNDGDELFYTYDDDLKKEDLKIIKLQKI